MCYPVYGMMHIKEPLRLIRKSSPCDGSGFPLLLSEWSFAICLTPYYCNCSSQCSMTGVTKVVVCAILSGMMHITEPLLLIGKSSPRDGSRFSLLLSEWSFAICLTPYNRKCVVCVAK